MKILKNYFYNMVYQMLSLITPLITAPYLARVLGAEGTGIYSYVNSMAIMICSITMLGIYNYGNRQIAYDRDNPDKLNETFWHIMTSRFLIGVFSSIVYFFVVFAIGKYTLCFLLYYTYMLGYYVDCSWLFVGVEDMKWAVLKNTFIKILSVLGIFLLVKTKDDVGCYILIQGCSILFGNLSAYSQIKRYVGRPKFILSGMLATLKGSVVLYLPGIASTLYLQCDKIMLGLMNDSNQVAFYDYGEKIITVPLTFITVLSTVMMPRIANEFKKKNSNQISILITIAAKLSTFFALPMMVGLFVLSDKLIPWYLGTAFNQTIYVIKILSPIIVANTLIAISGGQYFTATNQVRVLLKAQISAAVGNIILNAILIPAYGPMGAAVATTASSVTNAVIQYSYLVRQIKLNGFLKSVEKQIICVVAMGATIIMATCHMKATPITTGLQFLIGIMVYFTMAVLMRDETLLYVIQYGKNKWKKRGENR